jgi:hypothetical protein
MTVDQVDLKETERPHAHRIATFALFRGLAAFALLGAGLLVAVSPASAATTIDPNAGSPMSGAHTIGATTLCNNGVGGGGGQGVICEITIVNTVTGTGGSAVVTIHECVGSAGAPLSGVCSTTTLAVAAPVTVVNQCNGTVEGGGGTLRCSVVITTNFYGGVSPGSTAATVDQCVGSGDGLTTGCNPLESTTSAAITQCNDSANGGTLVELTCTATGTMASALPVTINQCNGSANGGGGLVICSASMINNARQGTPPPTSTVSGGSSNNSTPPPYALLVVLALGGLGAAVLVAQRRNIRS